MCVMRVFVFVQGRSVNEAACILAKEVAAEGDALVLGGVSQTPAYLSGLGEEKVKEQYRSQMDVFLKHEVDFLLAEVNNPRAV